jgi:lipocalin
VCIAASKEIFELSTSMEAEIMRRAMSKAKELGYDTEKVLNIKWSEHP